MWQVKAHDDSCNVSRIGLDSVLASGAFVAFWGHWLTSEDELAGLLVCRDVEGLSIQHLKLNKVNMQRMDVACDVDERPYLSAAGLGIFGDGLVPTRVTQ